MSDRGFVAFVLYMIGLVILSIAVGTMTPSPQLGWLVLGIGFIVPSILIYLRPTSPDQSENES